MSSNNKWIVDSSAFLEKEEEIFKDKNEHTRNQQGDIRWVEWLTEKERGERSRV